MRIYYNLPPNINDDVKNELKCGVVVGTVAISNQQSHHNPEIKIQNDENQQLLAAIAHRTLNQPSIIMTSNVSNIPLLLRAAVNNTSRITTAGAIIVIVVAALAVAASTITLSYLSFNTDSESDPQRQSSCNHSNDDHHTALLRGNTAPTPTSTTTENQGWLNALQSCMFKECMKMLAEITEREAALDTKEGVILQREVVLKKKEAALNQVHIAWKKRYSALLKREAAVKDKIVALNQVHAAWKGWYSASLVKEAALQDTKDTTSLDHNIMAEKQVSSNITRLNDAWTFHYAAAVDLDNKKDVAALSSTSSKPVSASDRMIWAVANQHQADVRRLDKSRKQYTSVIED